MSATSGSGDATVPRGVDRLAEVVLESATVEEVLELVVEAAMGDVATAAGASVAVERPGEGNGLVASAAVESLAPVEYACGRGPGVEAMHRSARCHTAIVSELGRWPEFASAALQAGVVSVLALPLQADDRTFGALVLYATEETAFGPGDIRAATAVAAQAAVTAANALTLESVRDASHHLQESVATRGLIGQAQGILMARHGCSGENAFALLRRSSQLGNRKLREVAAEIVAEHDRRAGDGAGS